MTLITGCSGLIGKNLLPELLKKGEKIVCYDFSKPSWLPQNIPFFKGDLLNKESLKNALLGIDSIFHCLDIKRPSSRGRRYMRNVNIDGTAALLEAAKRAGVKHFFFISTLSVYGRERRSLFLRKKRWKPLTAYGKDKLMAESLCQKYNASGGLKVTIFRPAAIISPGTKDPAALACLYMALAMRKNSRACLYSRSARYQFLDIHDAVRALVLAAGSRSSGGKTYELASGEAPKREEELLALLEKTKLNFKIKKTGFARLCFYKMAAKLLGSSLFRGDHLNYLVGGKVTDCAEIKKDLGWRPSVGNVEILVEACRWYKEEKLKQSVSF